MGHYPFTPFNLITAFVLLLAVAVVVQRFRRSQAATWPLFCYAAFLAYAIGFSGGLNPYGVLAGALCAVGLRLNFYPRILRWPELAALGYVFCRSLGLLLMW